MYAPSAVVYTVFSINYKFYVGRHSITLIPWTPYDVRSEGQNNKIAKA